MRVCGCFSRAASKGLIFRCRLAAQVELILKVASVQTCQTSNCSCNLTGFNRFVLKLIAALIPRQDSIPTMRRKFACDTARSRALATFSSVTSHATSRHSRRCCTCMTKQNRWNVRALEWECSSGSCRSDQCRRYCSRGMVNSLLRSDARVICTGCLSCVSHAHCEMQSECPGWGG